MTPADGSDIPQLDWTWTEITDFSAILLHGGVAMLLFEALDHPLPRSGHVYHGGRTRSWHATNWRTGKNGARDDGQMHGWCALAVLDALPRHEAEVRDPSTNRAWRLGPPRHVDVAAQPLANFARANRLDCRAVIKALADLKGEDGTAEGQQASRTFLHAFLTAAADLDGFIEILATPEEGILVAQGWSTSLEPGHTELFSSGRSLALRRVEIAGFAREDIPAPGRGICIHATDWCARELEVDGCVFFEIDGQWKRLDISRATLLRLEGELAAAHIRQMLGRLVALEPARHAFRRICRPSYDGVDTLSATPLPIAAALDVLAEAPDGSLLAMGWILDPTRRVDSVHLGRAGGPGYPLKPTWCNLPRPDLHIGFADDPRFAEALEADNTMHGFIAYVPPPHAEGRIGSQGGAPCDTHLELVLEDDTCLFLPLRGPQPGSLASLSRVLAAISPTNPDLGRIIEDHVARFLCAMGPTPQGRARSWGARLIALGEIGSAQRFPRGVTRVSAIMPFRSMAELQPVLGILAGSEEAEVLEIIITARRHTASEHLRALQDAFDFYGLVGGLVIAPDKATPGEALDAGASVASAPIILRWDPSVLPKAPAWLAGLLAEYDALPHPGLLSPALTYEDESIYFGGDRMDETDAGSACALTGYSAHWLPRGRPERVSVGAAEIALIDRDLLERAGGFSRSLLSDAYAHVDLAASLRRLGSGAWCAGAVEFWMLEEGGSDDETPLAGMLKKVDAVLLRQRSQASTAKACFS
jgi:hypothetical protein